MCVCVCLDVCIKFFSFCVSFISPQLHFTLSVVKVSQWPSIYSSQNSTNFIMCYVEFEAKNYLNDITSGTSNLQKY